MGKSLNEIRDSIERRLSDKYQVLFTISNKKCMMDSEGYFIVSA